MASQRWRTFPRFCQRRWSKRVINQSEHVIWYANRTRTLVGFTSSVRVVMATCHAGWSGEMASQRWRTFPRFCQRRWSKRVINQSEHVIWYANRTRTLVGCTSSVRVVMATCLSLPCQRRPAFPSVRRCYWIRFEWPPELHFQFSKYPFCYQESKRIRFAEVLSRCGHGSIRFDCLMYDHNQKKYIAMPSIQPKEFPCVTSFKFGRSRWFGNSCWSFDMEMSRTIELIIGFDSNAWNMAQWNAGEIGMYAVIARQGIGMGEFPFDDLVQVLS